MKHMENVDATDELMSCVECAPEEHETKPLEELVNIEYDKLSEEDKKYLISALKMKNNELDDLTQKLFTEVKRVKEARNKDLIVLEDTLTFIKTTVAQSLGAVTLAIEHAQKEVKRND